MPAALYVIEEAGQAVALVEANTNAQAVRHAVRGRFRARPLSALEAARLIGGGMRVESAISEQAELPDDQEAANG